jgi:hypothetical protein
MEISFRELMTALHGMGFAALFLLGFSGVAVGIGRFYAPDRATTLSTPEKRFLRLYLLAMVVLAWAAVLSGAYVVYPWYRAHPPAGVADLTDYPQRSLLAHPATAGWHNLGMEWKEHVAWFAPIAMTMVAYVFTRYASDLSKNRGVRNAVLAFGIAAFLAAAIAGMFGAFLNKRAPIQGGAVIRIMK